MVKIGISGVCGRMGLRIAEMARKDPDVIVSSAFERHGIPEIGKDLGSVIGANDLGVKIKADMEAVSKDLDCVIEFTLPAPTLEHLEFCVKNGISLVIGTTGFTPEGQEKIAEASKIIPIVFSPNMAIGVNVLFKIVSDAARVLGSGFGVRVDETHHVHKKDSPSGTAKMLAKVINEAVSVDPPIDAFRKGEVIGNHGIVFDGEYETIEIRHNAKSRDVFAAGAIEAAKFVADKSPGLYSMADVLGLK